MMRLTTHVLSTVLLLVASAGGAETVTTQLQFAQGQEAC